MTLPSKFLVQARVDLTGRAESGVRSIVNKTQLISPMTRAVLARLQKKLMPSFSNPPILIAIKEIVPNLGPKSDGNNEFVNK